MYTFSVTVTTCGPVWCSVYHCHYRTIVLQVYFMQTDNLLSRLAMAKDKVCNSALLALACKCTWHQQTAGTAVLTAQLP